MSTRVLVVDNYDSFVFTLVGYLQQLGAQTTVIRNDQLSPQQAIDLASDYDGILISPGPGAPADAGVSLDLIRHAERDSRPLFGVCLGHQAIAEVFGGVVKHSPELMHGKTSVLTHTGRGIFEGVRQPVTTTRYHSLAIADGTLPEVLEATAHTEGGIIMGVAHRTAPIHGVQFHPESVLTEDGYLMVGNFLELTGLTGAALHARGLSPLVGSSSSEAD